MFGAASNGASSGAKYETGIDNIFRVKFRASSVMKKKLLQEDIGISALPLPWSAF